MKIGKARRWLIRKLGGVPRDEIPIPSNNPFETFEVRHDYLDICPFNYEEAIPLEFLNHPTSLELLREIRERAVRKLAELLLDEGCYEQEMIEDPICFRPTIIFKVEVLKPHKE